MQPYPPILKRNARALRAAIPMPSKYSGGGSGASRSGKSSFIAKSRLALNRRFLFGPGQAGNEIDGAQHYTPEGMAADKQRDAFLLSQGLFVLRFNNLQVLQELDGVLERIEEVLSARICHSFLFKAI